MKTIAITYYITSLLVAIGLLVQPTIAVKPTPPPTPPPPTPTCNTKIYYYNSNERYDEKSGDRLGNLLSETSYAPLYDRDTDDLVGTFTQFNKFIPTGSGPELEPTCQSSTNLYLDFESQVPLSTVVVQGFCSGASSGAIVGGTGDYTGAYGTLSILAVQGKTFTFLKYCKPVAQPE